MESAPTSPWPAIAARLDAGLLAVPVPASYHVGRRSGRGDLPDNILLFLRRDIDVAPAPDHHHHRHVLILALAGAGGVCVDRHVHALQPGRAVLILPHQLHHYVDVHPPLRWLFVTFEAADGMAWQGLFNRMAALDPDQEALLRRLLAAFADDRPAAAERLGLVLALLLGELGDRLLPAPAPSDPAAGWARIDVLEQVNRILYSRLDQGLGIAALAAELGLSASHLRSLVRRSLGLSLGQYILRVRVNQARILLRDRRLRVGEVARRCGFGSLPAFSRAFRRLTGETPRLARRRDAPA